MKNSALLAIKRMAVLFTVCISFLSPSCKKDLTFNVDSPKLNLIEDAKNYFEKEVLALNNKIPNDQNARHSLKKFPVWKLASIRKMSIGNVVLIPLEYDKDVFLKRIMRKEQ